jgi:hypothetical protein
VFQSINNVVIVDDETRVVLDKNSESDYINASFIHVSKTVLFIFSYLYHRYIFVLYYIIGEIQYFISFCYFALY